MSGVIGVTQTRMQQTPFSHSVRRASGRPLHAVSLRRKKKNRKEESLLKMPQEKGKSSKTRGNIEASSLSTKCKVDRK